MAVSPVVLDKVKKFLNLDGTTIYDDKLTELYIPSAINSLKTEGVKEYTEGEEHFETWCICIACKCQMMLDYTATTNENVLRLYITSVNEIRTL